MASGPAADRQADGSRPLRVTTVARLGVTKGLTYLIDAIAELKPDYPDVQFRVYGDGELRSELVDRAAARGLDGNAIFVGPFTRREDLSAILARTDVFVLSSILEGQPLALVEAMAYGCPIVATMVGGIPELIEDGVNGLLCPPRDVESLARQLRTLFDDPALRRRLGQAARQSYERSPFQPTSVCDGFASLYRNVLQQANLEPATL
jgi:glycosyltransferase involved in cell wall biosynthesis